MCFEISHRTPNNFAPSLVRWNKFNLQSAKHAGFFPMRGNMMIYFLSISIVSNVSDFVHLLQVAGSSIEPIMLHLSLPIKGNEIPQASFLILRHCITVLNWNKKQIYRCVNRPASNQGNTSFSFPQKR